VVKCSEVLQSSDGLSNKVSNIIRRHIENMKLLLIYRIFCYYHILSYLMYIRLFSCFNTVIYVFYCYVLLYVYAPIVCLCIYFMFIYSLYVYVSSSCQLASSATLNEVIPCFFLSCKANARVKPAKMGHSSHSS
jgi:hypothetical protein